MKKVLKKSAPKARKKISRTMIALLVILLLLIIAIIFAGLTKTGVISNCFGIEMLCPNNAGLMQNQPDVGWQIPVSSSTVPNNNSDNPGGLEAWKPVIYLYPATTQDVKVELKLQGDITAAYPDYDNKIDGWDVTAFSDGKIINHQDQKEYSYLFWEGQTTVPTNYDLSSGFVVAGKDTKQFLQTTLAQIGLLPKEYNEFIVYWYPKMKDNQYNLVHFAGDEYTKTAPLTITPTPEAMLRVFMVTKPLTTAIAIKPQTFTPFVRTGFTVVEWGGTQLAK